MIVIEQQNVHDRWRVASQSLGKNERKYNQQQQQIFTEQQ